MYLFANLALANVRSLRNLCFGMLGLGNLKGRLGELGGGSVCVELGGGGFWGRGEDTF